MGPPPACLDVLSSFIDILPRLEVRPTALLDRGLQVRTNNWGNRLRLVSFDLRGRYERAAAYAHLQELSTKMKSQKEQEVGLK